MTADANRTRRELLAHALRLPGAWVDHPWDEDAVAKVGRKVAEFDAAATGGR